MPTKPLPFFEKDAIRWRDHSALVLNELRLIIQATVSPSVTTRLEALYWQVENTINDIDTTLSERKKTLARK
jgi:hypothetical protein